ncbi:MAG: hypothetical protein V9E87_03405 [Gemmatimonadales bacterium]
MAYAFTRLRPIFRERGKLNAEVTGRLVESIAGIRVVKAYTAERREQHAFAKGANKLFRNVAATMTGVSRHDGALHRDRRHHRHAADRASAGRHILAGRMTQGDLFPYVFLDRPARRAADPDRRASGRRSPRPSPASTASASCAPSRPRTRTTPTSRRWARLTGRRRLRGRRLLVR